MTKITLSIAERKAHRAEAHHLNPVVMIGADGLTEGVQKEIDAALDAHGLIKVRVAGDDRAAREAWFEALCEALSAAPIQHIGKLLVLWRPIPEKDKERDEDRMAGPKTVKFSKSNKNTGRREVKTLRVLGNERVTRGGLVKRGKPKQQSLKKAGRS